MIREGLRVLTSRAYWREFARYWSRPQIAARLRMFAYRLETRRDWRAKPGGFYGPVSAADPRPAFVPINGRNVAIQFLEGAPPAVVARAIGITVEQLRAHIEGPLLPYGIRLPECDNPTYHAGDPVCTVCGAKRNCARDGHVVLSPLIGCCSVCGAPAKEER